jgi:hypothetical protein
MADGIDNSISEETESASGFDFAQAEKLVKEGKPDATNKPEGEEIEGDIETAEEQAKMQAKSVVGLMDMSFSFLGNDKYVDSIYSEGARHITPAIIRMSFRIPAIEYINAALWTGFRLVKSIKEVKFKAKEKESKKNAAKQQSSSE